MSFATEESEESVLVCPCKVRHLNYLTLLLPGEYLHNPHIAENYRRKSLTKTPKGQSEIIALPVTNLTRLKTKSRYKRTVKIVFFGLGVIHQSHVQKPCKSDFGKMTKEEFLHTAE